VADNPARAFDLTTSLIGSTTEVWIFIGLPGFSHSWYFPAILDPSRETGTRSPIHLDVKAETEQFIGLSFGTGT
jgi:hypothetical protein